MASLMIFDVQSGTVPIAKISSLIFDSTVLVNKLLRC